MKKETRGRKPLKAKDKKSVRVSVRCTQKDAKLIKKYYGTLQFFFDEKLSSFKDAV